MIIIKKVISTIRYIQRNKIFYIFGAVQLICLVTYYLMSQNLEKPAGLGEALKFLFTAPNEYFLSIVTGVVSWLLSTIMVLSIIFEIPLIKELIEDDYSYNRRLEFENLETRTYIINIIIYIILLVANFIFLRFLLVLVALLAIIMVIMFFLSTSNN